MQFKAIPSKDVPHPPPHPDVVIKLFHFVRNSSSKLIIFCVNEKESGISRC